jgi:hypothetical protein
MYLDRIDRNKLHPKPKKVKEEKNEKNPIPKTQSSHKKSYGFIAINDIKSLILFH